MLEQGKFIGMISRRQLLEFLIRPYGQELFTQESLGVHLQLCTDNDFATSRYSADFDSDAT